MPRQRTIVGLGETLLLEYPDRSEPAGLAAIVALQAVRLGHVGVAISRVGQDEAAEELLTLLNEAGIDASHIQNDPDLPTGRVIVRAIGGRIARYLESRAAFDNLQSDFDLEDVGQKADAVIYGLLTRRGGQTRSEENRFLAACSAAVKVFDLTNRAGPPDRGQAMSGLELADAAIADATAIDVVLPGWADAPPREAALHLLREAQLSLVLMAEPADANFLLTAHTSDGCSSATVPAERPAFLASIIAFLHGVLNGNRNEQALELAQRIGEFTVANPGESVPREWL
jgi:sugar/nucleoside kinase (ribokinase family)